MGSFDPASAAVLLVTVLIAVIAAGSLIKERKNGGCGCGRPDCMGSCRVRFPSANRKGESK